MFIVSNRVHVMSVSFIFFFLSLAEDGDQISVLQDSIGNLLGRLV